MSAEDKILKVWVGGKLITINELQQKYETISVTGEKASTRAILYLARSDKPLTLREIAKEIKVSSSYTITMLKDLAKKGLVLKIDMAGSRFNFYVLTEKGYNLSKTLKKE